MDNTNLVRTLQEFLETHAVWMGWTDGLPAIKENNCEVRPLGCMGVEGIKCNQQNHSPDLEYQGDCNTTVNDLADE
jgi:hypothetical protein